MQLLLPMLGIAGASAAAPAATSSSSIRGLATLQRDGAARADALYVVIASLLKAAAH